MKISNLTAILFALFGFTSWVLGDACIKWISEYGIPSYEIVAFMGFFMSATLFLQSLLRGELKNLRPHSWLRQLLRASLDLGNNICVAVALKHLSLNLFYILVFLSPLVISTLSALLLGEHSTPRKNMALLLGFCGVVIAVAPWSHAQKIDLIGVGSCLVCVACFSTNMVWSRVLTRTETPESLAFCSGIVTAIMGGLLSVAHPASLTTPICLAMMLMGIFCAAGTLSFYIAVKHTSANNVSPFHYTQLLTGTLLTYLIWHERPGLPILVGGSLILFSGAWIAWSARSQQQSV